MKTIGGKKTLESREILSFFIRRLTNELHANSAKKNGFDFVCDAVESEWVGLGANYFQEDASTNSLESGTRGKEQLCDTGGQLRKKSPSDFRKSGENLVHLYLAINSDLVVFHVFFGD